MQHEDKVSHEDMIRVTELVESEAWEVLKRLSSNYIWATRKKFDTISNEKDMFFAQGEIAGIKWFLKRIDEITIKVKRKERENRE